MGGGGIFGVLTAPYEGEAAGQDEFRFQGGIAGYGLHARFLFLSGARIFPLSGLIAFDVINPGIMTGSASASLSIEQRVLTG